MSSFAPPSPALDTELREIERRRCEAICNRDLDLLTAMMSDTLTYVHIHGNTEDKAAYLEGLISLRDFRSVDREYLEIRVLGDVALMTGIQKVQVRRMDNDSPDYRELVVYATQVWTKTDDAWQMELYQSTKL